MKNRENVSDVVSKKIKRRLKTKQACLTFIWLYLIEEPTLSHFHRLRILSMRRCSAISHDAVLGSSGWRPPLHRLIGWHAVRTFQPKTFQESLACGNFFSVSRYCTFCWPSPNAQTIAASLRFLPNPDFFERTATTFLQRIWFSSVS